MAAVEFSYGLTSANPTSIKSASSFSSSEGTFSSTSTDPESPLESFDDLFLAFSIADSENSTWGIYYKKCLETTAEYVGKNSVGTVLMTKKSTLDGWLVGLVRKYYWNSRDSKVLNGFIEFQLAAGKASYDQTIVDTTSITHAISGSAFVIETNAYLGLQAPIWEQIDGIVKIGYGRMHSSYFTADSVSGSRYGSLTAGDRMAVRSGEDVRLIRDGLSFQLGLFLSF